MNEGVRERERVQSLGWTEREKRRHGGKKGAEEWAAGKGMNEWRVCLRVGGRRGERETLKRSDTLALSLFSQGGGLLPWIMLLSLPLPVCLSLYWLYVVLLL